MAITSRDVARRAGVSQSTVSYVLSGKRAISEETRQRVLDAVAELTYEPNAGARALKGQRTFVLGLMIPSSSHNAALSQVTFIEAIAQRAREHDFDVLVVTADEGAEGIHRLARRSLCDGLILMEVLGDDDERITTAEAVGLPTMLIGVPSEIGAMHAVDEDFQSAGAMAVSAAAQQGAQRILVLGFPDDHVRPGVNFVPRFYAGASAAATAAGLEFEVVTPKSHRPADVAEVLRDRITQRGGRAGVVVATDSCMSAVYEVLARESLQPGSDVVLVTHSSEDSTAAFDPTVTRILMRPRTVSNLAVDGLVAMLNDPASHDVPSIQLLAPEQALGVAPGSG